MGLVTIPGTNIQFFSFSEEIQAIGAKFFSFIFNIAPGWLILITAISLAFIVIGVWFRLRSEIEDLQL